MDGTSKARLGFTHVSIPARRKGEPATNENRNKKTADATWTSAVSCFFIASTALLVT
jgi:hypothetical protein